ncbi:NADH dehydrogenase [Cladophialophora yegresii CBS 114405]|uniref:NADH dehydrogenase [ubiquinone] 1 alpha subcomplex subunit 13 n=1 Tax=Cladophialophora yegresii CBS 114405 TaxID=1182544 RepID=W9W4Z6_9EURO|nr:NADH dehydrogenase [Cladophialophora yegresii CBS 114405]EXJ60070.1 NADH dehydrogenase [Cladophialophora yegresii CBS 114405]
MPQDLPPSGGYEAVQYRRNIPTRGLRPLWYLVGMLGVVTYGWRQIFLGQREKTEMAREKMWARIHLTPLLQAEEDRDQVRRYYADLKREKELLGSQIAVGWFVGLRVLELGVEMGLWARVQASDASKDL